jgi:hypothetical protein
MRGSWMMALALAPLLTATSCPTGIGIQVEPPPAAAEPPSFALTHWDQDGTAASFEVRECAAGGQVMWRITLQTPYDTAPDPLRMAYGRPPRGYREEERARPLAPGGCYRAAAAPSDPRGEGGSEVFRLLPTGSIVQGTADQPEIHAPELRELNRAAVSCVRGYRRARTAADSAAVDAAEHDVVDARLSCGWMRRQWPDALAQTRTRGERFLFYAGSAAFFIAIPIVDNALF